MEMTFSQWFPIWFRALPLRYRLLMYLNGLAVIYEALQALYLFWKKKTEPFRFGLLKISVLAGILYWVLSAPDVRFAWGFLAAFPVICIFSSVIWEGISRYKPGTADWLFKIMAFAVCGYVFTKANCLEVFRASIAGRINLKAFYIYQGDFSVLPVEEYIINGDTFYWSPAGDQAGYYGFPGTTDKALLDNLGYLGENFEDGVYYKGGQSW